MGGRVIEQFWEQRASLRHVRDFARGRRVCPWSTLGVVLVRAACHLPPHVYLPPLVGGRTSLNLFCALVGPSGVGKGGSESAGRDAITFTGTTIEQLDELPLGSGEGIARTLGDRSEIHTALFTAAEIDSLAALFTRQGSTLEGELRKLWTGETLGFTNAQKDTRTRVERLSYRAGVIVGVQPLRAHTLLNGADGGTPQRFMWMPVLDPQRPTDRPPRIDPHKVTIPDFLPGELDVPDTAVQAIDEHQAAIHRQDPDVDPLAGHALLCRLKIACAVMVLDERMKLNEDDWRLAGHVMAVSDHTRASVQDAAREQARTVNHARAHAAAEREEIISERKLQRCKDGILRVIARLSDGQWIPGSQLRRSLKSDVRDYFDSAAADLIAENRISARCTPKGMLYAGPPVDHRSTPTDLRKWRVDHRSTVDPDRPHHRRRERTKYRRRQQTKGATA
jgi:hypothetical protein